jgi:Leucine-rich repeat (LRR) protein
MKPAIEKVKEEAVKAGYSTVIKLSNDNNIDFLDYSEKLLDLACPEDARVNLSQEKDSGTWIKLEAGNDKKAENPLVADAKARKERGR